MLDGGSFQRNAVMLLMEMFSSKLSRGGKQKKQYSDSYISKKAMKMGWQCALEGMSPS